jgi:hypothetical protein
MFVGAALSGMFPWTRHVPAAALLSLATSHGRTYRVRAEGGEGVTDVSMNASCPRSRLAVLGYVTWKEL